MNALAREEAPIVLEGGGMEVRLEQIGGGMSTSFIRLPHGADLGPAVKGLPGDACQCPHWGYILKGKLLMRTPHGEQTYAAGQAVYWAPGHIPVALEDTEYVDFSPTEEFNQVIDHLRAQAG